MAQWRVEVFPQLLGRDHHWFFLFALCHLRSAPDNDGTLTKLTQPLGNDTLMHAIVVAEQSTPFH